jgi:hypothetical protein
MRHLLLWEDGTAVDLVELLLPKNLTRGKAAEMNRPPNSSIGDNCVELHIGKKLSVDIAPC